jgi:hypothetical protein
MPVFLSLIGLFNKRGIVENYSHYRRPYLQVVFFVNQRFEDVMSIRDYLCILFIQLMRALILEGLMLFVLKLIIEL